MWIQTHTGGTFDLLEPRKEDVRIADIATHLSRIARFNGATKHTASYVHAYSVAQHCVLVSRILEQWGAPMAVVREGLLHDAGEAYYGDVVSPVLRALRELANRACAGVAGLPDLDDALRVRIVEAFNDASIAALQKRTDRVVREALSLPPTLSLLVQRADLVALACERHALMAPCERDWGLPEFADSRWTDITPVSPWEAREAFMARLEALDGRLSPRLDDAGAA